MGISKGGYREVIPASVSALNFQMADDEPWRRPSTAAGGRGANTLDVNAVRGMGEHIMFAG